MKDGHYICTVIFGNNKIDLHGYNSQLEYAYLNDINITEMLIELNAWDKITDAAYAERPWA